MSIFRQLRWKLTLTYTIVTVSAFLVIILILGGLLFAQIFLPGSYLNPEQLIEGWLNSTIPSTYLMWSAFMIAVSCPGMTGGDQTAYVIASQATCAGVPEEQADQLKSCAPSSIGCARIRRTRSTCGTERRWMP